MRFVRHVILSCLVGAGMVAAGVTGAFAKWPMDRTMTIVVPWPAGTGADLVARVIADGLQKKWNNTVIVENKVGAIQTIGLAEGHTSTRSRRGEPVRLGDPTAGGEADDQGRPGHAHP